MGVLTPLVVQVIPSINMVECGYTAYEPCQIFSRVFASFIVVAIDTIIVDVVVVVDKVVIVVVGSIVVVEFEQEL